MTRKIDTAGYERFCDRYGFARAVLDLTEKLYGEVSAGYLREAIDDPRLRPVEGPTLAAALNWSPIRGTLVRLSGDTAVEGTTSAGDSGSILYSGRLSVERELRANLTARPRWDSLGATMPASATPRRSCRANSA